MIIYKLVNRILDIYKALVFSKDNHNYYRTFPLQYNNDGDRSFMSISIAIEIIIPCLRMIDEKADLNIEKHWHSKRL